MVKNRLLLIICTLFCFIQGCSQPLYERIIQVDIEFDDNIINVSISSIYFESDFVLIEFPKTIIGTYHYIDNLVDTIYVTDRLNNTIIVLKVDGCFKIPNAKSISEISYKVRSSEYTTFNVLSKGVIISDSLIALNNNTIFGNISGVNIDSILLVIHKSKILKNISNQQIVSINDTTDNITYSTYHDLINSPIIYSLISTVNTFYEDSTKISVGIHGGEKKISSKYLSEIIKPVIKNVLDEIELIVVPQSYNFVFLFNEIPKNAINQYTALEHFNSSVYMFFSAPNLNNSKDSLEFVSNLKCTVAHELLHLFTPINFSDEFKSGFYSDSLQMSQHLWLYEGFVEYQSLKILLINKIIDFNTFISKIEEKMNYYSRFEKMKYYTSLAKVSENIYNKHQLSTFYNRAAVLCFLMDIEVIELSKGNYNLFSLLKEIYNDYPTFHKDSLFSKMNNIVPEIDNFINRYILDDKYPDLSFYLSKAGLEYSKVIKEYGYYFPIEIIDNEFKKKTGFIKFSKNVFPFKEGDIVEITEINGMPITSYSLSFLYRRYFDAQKTFNIKYLKNGKLISTTIKPILARVPRVPYYPHISVNSSMTSKQRIIYNKLFERK